MVSRRFVAGEQARQPALELTSGEWTLEAMARARARGALATLALSMLIALGACKDEPPPAAQSPAADPAEGSAEKKPAVDPKIANAMAAAEASARSESGQSSSQAAPPPDGILGVEAAAREVAPGAPAQIVVGGEGSEPRVRLGAERIAPGPGPAGKLVLSYRSGGSVMPTIEFGLAPKVAPVGAATQPASVAPTPAAGEGNLVVSFALTGARPADNQPGRLPDNARAEIAKLNGSTIDLVMLQNGALVEQRHRLAGNNAELEPIVAGGGEALASVVLPYPNVAVGVGAFWMVKSRETLDGAPVIAYRMVKLLELGAPGAAAKLSVNTRRYLIEPSMPLSGLPPHQVRRFESEGEATVNIKPGSSFPDSAETRDGFMALVTPNDRPNQAMPLRSELSANVSFQR